MKISGSELRKIIQEEVNRFLENEQEAGGPEGSPEGADAGEAAEVDDVINALSSGQGLAMLRNRMPRTPEAVVQLISWILKTDTKTPDPAKRKALEALFSNRNALVAAKEV